MFIELLDCEVCYFVNEHCDNIEIDIFYYRYQIVVNAMIMSSHSPYDQIVGIGKHRNSRKTAIQRAIKDLNSKAYKKALP